MFMLDMPPISELDMPDIGEGLEEDLGMLDIVMEDIESMEDMLLLMGIVMESIANRLLLCESRSRMLLALCVILPSLPFKTF